MEFKTGRHYRHRNMIDCAFFVVRVYGTRITGYWFTRTGRLLSNLSETFDIKKPEQWMRTYVDVSDKKPKTKAS